MHEKAIAQKIIDQVKGNKGIKEITLEVGDLAHLPAEDLKETLEQMVDWKINIIEKKAKVKCNCGFIGEPNIIERSHDFTLFECPQCKSLPEIIDGKDIKIKEIICG